MLFFPILIYSLSCNCEFSRLLCATWSRHIPVQLVLRMEKYLEIYDLSLPQGLIRGAKRETLYGKQYFSFEGIPYAKPPLGELRFKAPVPAESWSDVLDCTMYRSKPVQLNEMSGEIEGSEDCLYINIYAKKLKSNKPLPVMLFIYGGGFYMGEATRERYGPDYFMDEDVILVTFTYRIGSLGFLSLKDPKLRIPGNSGLKDQILAIKWVNKYISHFNGDPKNITVFGESAGATSTHYMCLTEQTRGLFQRTILMSGCAISFWANKPHVDMPYRLAKHNGYTGKNIDEDVLSFLRSLEPEKLVGHDLLNDEERRKGYSFLFGPVVETYVEADCVVPTTPLEMVKTAWTNSIPMMIGGTSDEGLLFYGMLKKFPEYMRKCQDDLERLLPVDVLKNSNNAERQALAEKIKHLHFDNKELNEKTISEFVDYFSYKFFWHGVLRTIFARLEYAPNVPTYLYRFAFDSEKFNLYRLLFVGGDPIRGVSHADDLAYLFLCKEAWKLAEDSEEYKTIRRMVSLWTSFGKNSDPNNDLIKPAEWKPLKKSDPYQALNISNDVQVKELPEKSKLEVWNSLYSKGDLY